MQTTQKRRMSLSLIAVNGLIAALYVALSLPFASVAVGAIQFRLSESLNHLVVFNRRLLLGVVAGVVIFNAFFGYGILDVLFGGGQTLLALSVTAAIQKFVPNVKVRLFLNSLFFVISMALIAWMLQITAELPFWATYGTLAASEAIIMGLSAPIMYAINRRVRFESRV